MGKSIAAGVGVGGPQETFLWDKIRKLLDNGAGV